MGNTYNRVYIWCCKYGENRYCERCANKKLCASKHTGLLNSCLGKLCLHPYLVVPLISARVTPISTRVSAHCQAILLDPAIAKCGGGPVIGQILTGFYGTQAEIRPKTAHHFTGSRPDCKTWRLFYFGDLWPEGLLASLTYINGPSGDRQIWKVLRWKSDKYFKMNIRTIQLNGPIQCKILFYTSVPDFVIISTTFMWYLRKNRAALGEHCISCQDGVQKSDFVT